jgi:secondary thiamine-phosphate synthase enzyme
MLMLQKEMILAPFNRGVHLITELITDEFSELKNIEVGMAQIFIKHTSASLTINENADPTVRTDFEKHLNVMVPENAPYFIHTYEGPDDMPAHIKASLMGSSVMIPVTNGTFNLGIWQGIYLCEHRDRANARTLLITVWGL